jgi:hypothetical protein
MTDHVREVVVDLAVDTHGVPTWLTYELSNVLVASAASYATHATLGNRRATSAAFAIAWFAHRTSGAPLAYGLVRTAVKLAGT